MGISSPGIGSGLDVNSIVSQLMAVERQPLQRLDQKEARAQADISAYGSLSSALSSLQLSLDKLKEADTFSATTAASSDPDVFSLTSAAGMVASSYDVTVDRLAQRHKLGSSEFSSSDTFGGVVGDALTLTVGTHSFTLDLSTAQTLQEIQQTINTRANETGVSAGIITGDAGNQTLVLTAGESGYENRVQLSFGGTLDASSFGFTTTNRDSAGALLASNSELDAALSIDGVTVTRGSNEIDDAIEGLTLSLQREGRAEAAITADTDAVIAAANAFIGAYNDLNSRVSELQSSGLGSGSLLRGIGSQVRGMLNQAGTSGGGISFLSQLGISSDAKSGELKLDREQLLSVLEQNEADVTRFFSDSTGGFAVRMDILMNAYLEPGGAIEGAIDGANSQIDRIDSSRISMERRLETIERRYLNQFSSLDTLMSQLSSTSDYLAGQLDMLAQTAVYNKK